MATRTVEEILHEYHVEQENKNKNKKDNRAKCLLSGPDSHTVAYNPLFDKDNMKSTEMTSTSPNKKKKGRVAPSIDPIHNHEKVPHLMFNLLNNVTNNNATLSATPGHDNEHHEDKWAVQDILSLQNEIRYHLKEWKIVEKEEMEILKKVKSLEKDTNILKYEYKKLVDCGKIVNLQEKAAIEEAEGNLRKFNNLSNEKRMLILNETLLELKFVNKELKKESLTLKQEKDKISTEVKRLQSRILKTKKKLNAFHPKFSMTKEDYGKEIGKIEKEIRAFENNSSKKRNKLLEKIEKVSASYRKTQVIKEEVEEELEEVEIDEEFWKQKYESERNACASLSMKKKELVQKVLLLGDGKELEKLLYDKFIISYVDLEGNESLKDSIPSFASSDRKEIKVTNNNAVQENDDGYATGEEEREKNIKQIEKATVIYIRELVAKIIHQIFTQFAFLRTDDTENFRKFAFDNTTPRSNVPTEKDIYLYLKKNHYCKEERSSLEDSHTDLDKRENDSEYKQMADFVSSSTIPLSFSQFDKLINEVWLRKNITESCKTE